MTDLPIQNTDRLPPWVAGVEHRMHELDPQLSEDQLAIVLQYGEEVEFGDGEMMWEAGQRDAGFFVVLEGQLEIVDKRGSDESVIITHDRGHYGGEIVTMAGQGALVGGRAKGRTRVIKVETARLKELLALESELGEILLTSFVVRRMRMLAENQGEVTLYGIEEEAETARIRTFLSRQGIPHTLVETDKAADLPAIFDREACDFPALIIGGEALCRPSVRQVAEKLGVSAEIEDGRSYDVAIIGAGPSGLAAAVYGASEGLSVIVIEALVPGGQAGTSSRIENYLGFPTGISGQGLAGRAFLQATKFGAEIAVARQVETIQCLDDHIIQLDGGDRVRARSVIISSGAVYREPPVENLDAFTGGGVHYGASYLEAQLCRNKNIALIGGGNSAGQAAIYLAEYANKVSILVRNEGLQATMSSYLIDRIERAGNIEVFPHTEVTAANGDAKLRSITVRNSETGKTGEMEIAHLFVFIGAVPATDFLPPIVKLDDKGFVLTGDLLTDDDIADAGWKPDRAPFHLETTCPGILAVGDVRSGSVKRVASAVGEGSVCIQYVHRILNTV